MEKQALKPRQALNKAFLKVKPNRAEIDHFKTNLITLLDHIRSTESEEHHKNLIADFFKNTYYAPHHYINTKERQDLVIHNGNRESTVGVIIEAKKPGAKSEMVTTSRLNAKAFHELILYYLRERITHKNIEVRHLIITNIYEWFIFDAAQFDKLFAQNKKLVGQFTEFEQQQLSGTTTDFFYKNIAEPALATVEKDIEYTHFDIRDYDKPLRNADKADDSKLIALFKLLSPPHLLKQSFVNDSNSLDKKFYTELLHIIGLTEVKDGSKKLIQRPKAGDRHAGTLLEDAIAHLDSLGKLGRVQNQSQYGANKEERLFNIGLELAITWINRILFLKLLEAQLISYHKGDKSYSFLNTGKIASYDDLNSLFFDILAKQYDERLGELKKKFEKVPYLNSSLFEPTDLEHEAIMISNLKDDVQIPIHHQTVLKDGAGKKQTGKLSTLHYLFQFLDAYDFSSEGVEEIQEENKALINASVLGLIFEKINGYKDGSFFTPGFITMYMCRETIRRAVVEKFNDAKGWTCESIEDVYEKLEPKDRSEANALINSLCICDPAVGSGHFLVSALNEIISIKHDLKILQDRKGKWLKEYKIEVVNDELMISDESGFFTYTPGNAESQRVQETLFHEKEVIIENCLFGVDINPNSVKICRLRLWIELLKHAYYKNATELETLPNIDINIKCGNSLVSRFAIDADLRQALKKSKWSIDDYKLFVNRYQNAESKEEKWEMTKLINDIKSSFSIEISANDEKVKKLHKAQGELFNLTNQTSLFERSKKEKEEWEKQILKQTDLIAKLEKEIEEIKANKIFDNAFEWRFEFPEVLDDEGVFVGFDVVVANPPYIRQEELADFKPYFQKTYTTYAGTADLYVYFVEKGISLLKQKGEFIFILPNKWMRAGYGAALRKYIKQYAIQQILDFGDLPVFEEATTYPAILQLRHSTSTPQFKSVNITTLDFTNGLEKYVNDNINQINVSDLNDEGWTLQDQSIHRLLDKIKSKGIPLSEYVQGKIYRGVLTGLNEAFVIDEATKDRLIAEDPKSEEIIKPFLAGRDIKRYGIPITKSWLILLKNGSTQGMFGVLSEEEAYNKMSRVFPAVMKHLSSFHEKALKRWDKGQYWWELRACDYYQIFEIPKITYPDISKHLNFIYDINGHYNANTAYNIPTTSIELLGFLNSTLFLFYFKSISNSIRGGYMRFFSDYMEQCPVPVEIATIRPLVELRLQNRNGSKPNELESQIDQLVYELYGLTEEEIGIVEGKK